MKKIIGVLLVAVAVVLVVQGAGWGYVPAMISFQGRLTDTSGNPVTAMQKYKFSLRNAETSGTELWAMSKVFTPNSNGVFEVNLTGGVPELSTVDLSSAGGIWLEIYNVYTSSTIGIQQLKSVPFALRSSKAESLVWPAEGSSSNATKPLLTLTNTAPSTTPQTAAAFVGNFAGLLSIGNDGAGIIGVGSKASLVADADLGIPYLGYFAGVSGRGINIPGVAASSSGHYGVYAVSESTNKAGVLGIGTYGVEGRGDTGAGLKGIATTGYGVYSQNISDNKAAVYAYNASGAAGAQGVHGYSIQGSGIYGSTSSGIGVRGSAPTTPVKGSQTADAYTFGTLGAVNPRLTTGPSVIGTVRTGAYGQVHDGLAYGALGYQHEYSSIITNYGLVASSDHIGALITGNDTTGGTGSDTRGALICSNPAGGDAIVGISSGGGEGVSGYSLSGYGVEGTSGTGGAGGYFDSIKISGGPIMVAEDFAGSLDGDGNKIASTSIPVTRRIYGVLSNLMTNSTPRSRYVQTASSGIYLAENGSHFDIHIDGASGLANGRYRITIFYSKEDYTGTDKY